MDFNKRLQFADLSCDGEEHQRLADKVHRLQRELWAVRREIARNENDLKANR
ncbi:unnamed protein product, partial [Larinioides sclopetarius]